MKKWLCVCCAVGIASREFAGALANARDSATRAFIDETDKETQRVIAAIRAKEAEAGTAIDAMIERYKVELVSQTDSFWKRLRWHMVGARRK